MPRHRELEAAAEHSPMERHHDGHRYCLDGVERGMQVHRALRVAPCGALECGDVRTSDEGLPTRAHDNRPRVRFDIRQIFCERTRDDGCQRVYRRMLNEHHPHVGMQLSYNSLRHGDRYDQFKAITVLRVDMAALEVPPPDPHATEFGDHP